MCWEKGCVILWILKGRYYDTAGKAQMSADGETQIGTDEKAQMGMHRWQSADEHR